MVLQRDNYRCQIRGRRCLGSANEVDHIVPIVAGGAMYDPANLRAACKPCNSGRVSAERAQDGWKRAQTRITLVYGPPASGKSTLVNERKQPGDLVVDYDAIAESLGSDTSHGHSDAINDAASSARNALLRKLRRGESKADRAWIISANPAAVSMFPHHVAILCDPGQDEVHRRAVAAGRPPKWHQIINSWYAGVSKVDQPPGRRPW
jgi:hypothetical protein